MHFFFFFFYSQIPPHSHLSMAGRLTMHAIDEVCYCCHIPKLGPAGVVLIERLYYYRECYYTISTVYSNGSTIEVLCIVTLGI